MLMRCYSFFVSYKWMETEIESLGNWWHVSTYAITSFYCRKGSATMSCSRKIRWAEGFGGKGRGRPGLGWMVNRINIDGRPEWPTLHVSWLIANKGWRPSIMNTERLLVFSWCCSLSYGCFFLYWLFHLGCFPSSGIAAVSQTDELSVRMIPS